MKNIELKVKLNFSDISDNLNKLNPAFIGKLNQLDTYFLIGEKRLKIREEYSNGEIIYYARENKSESKDSKYFIFHLNKFSLNLLKKILSLFLGVKKVVKKQRDLYIYKNTRIHIDKVENLGEFLELETVVKDNSKYFEYQKEQKEVISSLNLCQYPQISYSYSDIIS